MYFGNLNFIGTLQLYNVYSLVSFLASTEGLYPVYMVFDLLDSYEKLSILDYKIENNWSLRSKSRPCDGPITSRQ